MLTATQSLTQANAIELSRTALVKFLDRAKQVVPARCPKPILTCVHLETSNGSLHLQATDCELSLFAQMPVDGVLSACVVSLAELSRRLKASKHATCSLSLSGDGERLLINGGRVEHCTPKRTAPRTSPSCPQD